jgi:hypothetical protein
MKLIERKLSTADHGIREWLEENLEMLPSRDTTAAEWAVVDLADASLRLPLKLDPQTAETYVFPRGTLHESEEAAVAEFLERHHYDKPPVMENRLFDRRLDDIGASETCLQLIERTRKAMEVVHEVWLSNMYAGSEEVSGSTLEELLAEADVYGDMPVPPRLEVRVEQALQNYQERAFKAFRDQWQGDVDEKSEEAREEFRQLWEERRGDVIDHIVSHLPDFVTKERGAPLNPLVVYLAETAGLTLQEIGDAYAVSRQAVSFWTTGKREAPVLEGAALERFRLHMQAYSEARKDKLEALMAVLAGERGNR